MGAIKKLIIYTRVIVVSQAALNRARRRRETMRLSPPAARHSTLCHRVRGGTHDVRLDLHEMEELDCGGARPRLLREERQRVNQGQENVPPRKSFKPVRLIIDPLL